MKIIYDADPTKPPKAYDDEGMAVELPPWVQHAWATGHETRISGDEPPVCADCPWPAKPITSLCPTCGTARTTWVGQ